jgi:hypothetical protein
MSKKIKLDFTDYFVFKLCLLGSISFAALMAGIDQDLANTFGDEPSVWFQRSGCVLVICSFYAEFLLWKEVTSSDEFFKNNKSLVYKNDSVLKDAITKMYKNWLSIFIHFNLIAGTLIWGYGDLIYSA